VSSWKGGAAKKNSIIPRKLVVVDCWKHMHVSPENNKAFDACYAFVIYSFFLYSI
jgi:hypothetical protein